MKRKEQLRHWELSEVNKMAAIRKPVDQAKVKFQDSDVFLSACISGDEDEVEDLLDNGANINVATIDGVTGLHQAVIDDNFEIVRFLIEHKADINAQDNEGWTPLHAAVCCGSLPIAKYLCEKGADLTLTNSDKELAIDLAEDDAIRFYLEDQLHINNIDTEKCRECESNLIMKDCSDWIRRGCYLDKPHSRTGATALHVAASKGYNQLIGMLLRAGADINVQDNEGWTPLHAAAHWADKEACRILIENGANVESENYAGQTVFMVADKSIIDYLKELKELQQPFSDRSNFSLDYQTKESLRGPLLEKSLTYNNTNISSNDLQSFSLNTDNTCEVENEFNSNVTGLIVISSSNKLPIYTTSTISSLVLQPTTQYTGCTLKSTINNVRLSPVVKSEEIDEDLCEGEEDLVCEEEDIPVETIKSSSSLKNSFSDKNNDIISNKNDKISDDLLIKKLAESSCTKKLTESERQSSIASTSSFSTEDTTGSNISSIVTTSRSVTPKECSSELYSSDQKIECIIPVQGEFQSRVRDTSNIFGSQVQIKKNTNSSNSDQSFRWNASTISSSLHLPLETSSAISGSLIRSDSHSSNFQNAHVFNQSLNDKNYKLNNAKSFSAKYSSESSSNLLSSQINSTTAILKKGNLSSNSSTETLSYEKLDDLSIKGSNVNPNMQNQLLSAKINNQLKNSNKPNIVQKSFDDNNLLDTFNKTTNNGLDNRLLKPTIATSAKASAKILSSGYLNAIFNSSNSTVQFPTSIVKNRSLPFSLKSTSFSIANENCSVNNQSYLINNNLKTSLYTPPMQPSSHKESESERKAKSRLQRHSRRSTQGVTLEHVGEAARQIQGSTSSSSIDDNEQKNLKNKNYEDNERLLNIDVRRTFKLFEKEISTNSTTSSIHRFENNNFNNNNGFENLSKWKSKTAVTNINNSLEEKKNNGIGKTNVNAYFKLPSQNYESASSSTSSISSKAKNDIKLTSTSPNYSISSTSNSISNQSSNLTVSSGKLNRRSQIVRGNRRRTGPVDIEAINVASLNKPLEQKKNIYTSQEDKKTSLKSLLSKFKNDSDEVNINTENFSKHDSLHSLNIDLINYKLLYKQECETSESLRKRIDELNQQTTLKQNSTTITNAIDDQERRSFERRIAALEYEIEKTKQLQSDHNKLKDENLALIRVLKKLSK